MFGSQALRLLRESWKSATSLAEELYAIFSSESMPLSHNGPITLTKNGDQAPLGLEGFSDGDTVMTFKKGNETKSIRFDGDTLIFPGTAEKAKDAKTQDVKPFVKRGTVASGSGTSYLVTLSVGNDVTATAPGVASGEKIPAGTPVLLFRIGESWFLNIPVWLASS